jgi:hypothetical protein
VNLGSQSRKLIRVVVGQEKVFCEYSGLNSIPRTDGLSGGSAWPTTFFRVFPVRFNPSF